MTSMRGSQATQESQSDVTGKDLEKIISDVVFYLLSQEAKRIPVKRVDLFKACNLQSKSRGMKEQILSEVKVKLSHIFGLQFVEINPKKGSSGVQYILVNEKTEDLKSREDNYLNWSDKENGRLGLLFSVLGLIFMSPDGVTDDGTLYSFLKKLSVYEDSMSMDKTLAQKIRSTQNESEGVMPEVYDLFGNVRDLIHKEWGSKMHYLDIKELPPKEGDSLPHYEFRWGERAELEVKKSNILTNICIMYNVPPSYFNEQRTKIMNGEDERDKEILLEYENSLKASEDE